MYGRRGLCRTCADRPRRENGDLPPATEVKISPHRHWGLNKLDQSIGNIPHPGKRSHLATVSVDCYGPLLQCLLDESRNHHAVLPGLTRSNGIKQADNNDREAFLAKVC